MPRQNRVTPYGELIAVPDRGTFWGNRGALLDREGRLARYSRGQAWAICVLSFKGRRRQQWLPGRLTELYFLDEATGLAAGHRPCGECRYRDYQAFKRAWAGSAVGGLPGAPEIDARLHAARLAAPGVRRTYQAPLAGLPAGTMVDIGGAPWLVHDGRLLAWTPGGYQARPVEAPDGPVTVITPQPTVAALAAGYRPVLHPTAGRPLRLRGYDMDAPSTSLEQHERGIHALRSGAGGTGVTKVGSRARMPRPGRGEGGEVTVTPAGSG